MWTFLQEERGELGGLIVLVAVGAALLYTGEYVIFGDRTDSMKQLYQYCVKDTRYADREFEKFLRSDDAMEVANRACRQKELAKDGVYLHEEDSVDLSEEP